MPSRSVLRRGPLTSLAGADPALALGDVDARHVRLTPTGLEHRLAERLLAAVGWRDVARVELSPPTTWWPHPMVGDTVWPVLAGLLGDATMPDITPFLIELLRTDGARVEWEVEGHYVSGYRRRDARAATRLIEHLVAVPDSRILLARPDELLQRISAVVAPPRIA